MVLRPNSAIGVLRILLAITAIWSAGGSLSHAALLMPDLIVTDFSEKDGVISFTLKNVGTKTAPVGHTATLSVNGQQKDSVLVNVTILPDKTYTTTFKKYRWACTTSGQYTLIVMADSAKKVDEIDEKNNSRQEVWTCDATPPAITAGQTLDERACMFTIVAP